VDRYATQALGSKIHGQGIHTLSPIRSRSDSPREFGRIVISLLIRTVRLASNGRASFAFHPTRAAQSAPTHGGGDRRGSRFRPSRAPYLNPHDPREIDGTPSPILQLILANTEYRTRYTVRRGGAIAGESEPRAPVPETQIHKVLHYLKARVKTAQGLLTEDG
jgi:hypothetical protein